MEHRPAPPAARAARDILCTLHRRVREVARWRRPRLVARGDPDRDRTLTALRQQLTELPRGAVVLAEDETHINLLPWVRATWIAHGQRQQVVTPGTNRWRSIFGAVDLASGRFFYLVARTAVSGTFIAFLERLQQAYPAAPVVWDLAGEPTPPAGHAREAEARRCRTRTTRATAASSDSTPMA